MRRFFLVLLCLSLLLSTCPLFAFADTASPEEGLYWRSVRWRDDLVEADPDCELLDDDIYGSPGYSEARQFVYVDAAGEEHALSDADLEFYGDYFAHMDGNPNFVHEGEVLVDIVFTGIGSDGWVKIKNTEFSLPIVSELPEYGFYSAPEASADTILSEWNYNGSNGTIYFIARNGAKLTGVFKDDDKPWLDLQVGEIEDGVRVALSTEDITSFDGGFQLHYSGVDAGGNAFENEQVWFFVNDERPLAFHWVNEDNDVFEVQEWLEREMWQAPGQECIVQFVRVEEDGTETPLKRSDLKFPSNVEVEAATHWDGSTEDDSYLHMSFAGPFGDFEIKDVTNGVSLKLHVDLPDWGYYSIEKPSVDDDHDEAWNDELRKTLQVEWPFFGEESTWYIRAAYNASVNTEIEEIIQESNHEVSWVIADDSRSAAVTLSDVDPEQPWLNLRLKIVRNAGTDDEDHYEQWANIRVRDMTSHLVVFWADSEWDEEEDRESITVRSWEDPMHMVWASPGQGWLVSFFVRSPEGDLSPVLPEELTWDESLVDVIDQGSADNVDAEAVTLILREFGESFITYQKDGLDLKLLVYCDLAGYGFYDIERPTVDQFIDGDPEQPNEAWNDQLREHYLRRWDYDGTNKTVYLRGSYNESLAYITEVINHSDHEIESEILEDGRLVKITLIELGTEDYLNLELVCEFRDDDGNVIYGPDTWGADIWLRNLQPNLTVERWAYFAESEDADPDWHLLEVFDEGEAGRWAGFVFNLKFVGPDGYISTGIDSSNEDIVTLSYDKSNEIWDVDVHGYGWAELTWTDPKDSKVYSFRIYGSEPDGFYTDPKPYLDAYLYYDEDIEGYAADYTIGEGCELYLRDFGYYEKGIKSVEVLSGNVTAEVVSLDKAVIRVDKTARGDIEAVLRITYDLYDGDDGADSEEVKFVFHGIRAAKRKLRSSDGLVEATVSKENGSAVLEGDMSEVEPILVTSYDENGRFLGLKVVTENTDTLLPEDGADSLSLFWIDSEFVPKSNSEEVELGE